MLCFMQHGTPNAIKQMDHILATLFSSGWPLEKAFTQQTTFTTNRQIALIWFSLVFACFSCTLIHWDHGGNLEQRHIVVKKQIIHFFFSNYWLYYLIPSCQKKNPLSQLLKPWKEWIIWDSSSFFVCFNSCKIVSNLIMTGTGGTGLKMQETRPVAAQLKGYKCKHELIHKLKEKYHGSKIIDLTSWKLDLNLHWGG